MSGPALKIPLRGLPPSPGHVASLSLSFNKLLIDHSLSLTVLFCIYMQAFVEEQQYRDCRRFSDANNVCSSPLAAVRKVVARSVVVT